MVHQFYKKHENIIGILALLSLCLWPLFFITKGIDEMDSGYYLANYKYFFSPLIYPTISTELSFLFGGLLYPLFPTAQFLAFRIIDWLCNCGIFILLYAMASKIAPRLWVVLGLFIGSVLIRRYPMLYSYNALSFFFLVLALYALYQGLTQAKLQYSSLSGFIIGFNVFFRLPNVLQGVLVFVPLCYALANQNFKPKALKHTLYFIAFGFLGLFSGLALTLFFAGGQQFILGIKVILGLTQSGSHAPSAMFTRIGFELTEAYHYLFFLKKYLLVALALPFILACISYGFKKTWLNYALLIFALIASLGLARYFGNNLTVNYYVWLLCLLSLCSTLVVLPLAFKNNPNLFLFACLTLCTLLTVPIGTDNGIFQFCLLGCVPSLSLAVYTFHLSTSGKTSFAQKLCKFYGVFIASLLFFSFAKGAYTNVLFRTSYNDGSYAVQTTTTQVPLLKHMHTSPQKADAFNTFYKAISNPTLQHKSLAVLGNFPLALAIANQPPFFKYPWADLGVVNHQALLESLQNANEKPLLLIGHFTNPITNLEPLTNFANQHYTQKIEHPLFTLYIPN